MAEFKLGRIRFIWKDSWTPSTVYYKDDIVRNGGNTYVCISGHTAPSLFTTSQSTYWNKISDGIEWKSNWQTNIYYKVNDIVKYGGYLYIANTAHTSAATTTLGLENDQSKWDLFCEGFDYKEDWDVSVRYKVNDIVKYNGTVYICVTNHTSAATTTLGLENDQSKWNIFSEGFYWTNDWSNTTRYTKNDIVRYGGQLYVCNLGHTSASTDASGLEADQAKWDYLNKGVEYLGDWTSTTRYKINDVVKYGGGVWICTTYHTSQTYFTDDEAKWDQFVEGLEFEDSWSGSARYQPGDFVTYGGYSYVAKTNNVGQATPNTNTTDWDLFTTGFRFIGDWLIGTAYLVGDVVRLGGYTYLCTTNSTGHRPPNVSYWQRLNSGIFWKDTWTNATLYDAGDAVQHGVNSYICILAHTSDQVTLQNRPDQDVTGVNWNLLSGGAEVGNLTTEGDLVYYGGAGPTRLGIGQPGQLLKVNNTGTSPEWAYFGTINNVYYVSGATGLNIPAPDYGKTLDRPWKTLRYATEQVEKGAMRINAKTLLEQNRSYIQAELAAWVAAQITAGTGIWTGFVNDNEYLTQVEFGKIVDALVWDLSHGGNSRTRATALSYFSSGSLIAAIADEEEQVVAAINQMRVVIDAVISNFAPSTTYQSVVTRVSDVLLVEESDAQTLINSLLEIITNSLTAGVSTGIPAQRVSQDTIFVKTGEFAEVLPIIVPANCAIVGDELRSTRIVPAGSLVHSSEVSYSVGARGRLQAIISDIVTDPGTVTKTTGNTLDPVTTRPVGSAGAGAAAEDLVQQISDYISFGIDGAAGDSTIPLVTGSNTPQTSTDYTYAVESIEANRAFLVAEILAFIADTYSDTATNTTVTSNVITITDTSWLQEGTAVVFGGTTFGGITAGTTYYVEDIINGTTFTISGSRGGTVLALTTATGSMTVDLYYNEAACAGDVNAYIDAIKYDLIYTGNYKSLLAARYYVNAVEGSILEDMFYMRNGTGLRNCTVAGLTGTLGTTNIYGTKRPTAGAFVGLDPGWGPNDTSAWITNKSPYVQNVSTFGTACVGLMVDGDLHAGGNDSIVANDFTQIISDGIGVWCTNLARTELVSVFSYYGHIGYLAENGGKIRATNGNSSYGTYGTVAEGVDVTEAPITGTVNNYDIQAIVSNVLTDGNNVLTLEYLNAGVNYTGAATTFSIAGEGYGTVINTVNTVNGGVFEVRLLETIEEPSNFGGAGYISANNVAQEGTTTSITISNTDTRLNAAYVGMAIYITAGRGAGQYGVISSYNSSLKLASIVKASDGTAGWDHVTGASIETTLNETTTYSIEPRLSFNAPASALYSDTTKARAVVEDGKIIRVLLWDPGQGYTVAPTMTVTDPNNTVEVPHLVRIGDGVLTQPTWTNRGLGFATAQATVDGDGYADLYQPGTFINIEGLSAIPQAGSNIEFDSIAGEYYKLVVLRNITGTGPYSAQFQISPAISISDAPEHGDPIELRIRYSQVRLTGHDFLEIGTGNFADTNYPNAPFNNPDPDKETVGNGGGRVFYTSTDQDGNFRVGRLFNVEQSTGIATLNADAFNISGLNELQLGAVSLGGTGAVITEFSTDGTFTANSDNIVPTQKAIKTYIASQIGGGAGELNVNSITAGSIVIATNQITTTTGGQINILRRVNYTGGISGDPVALNYFLS